MPFDKFHHGSNAELDREQLQYGKGVTTPQVEIAWTSSAHTLVDDGCAQIGFTVDWAVIMELARMYDAGNYGTDQKDHSHTFYTAPLSRRDLNAGVKALQRARNAVFDPDA